MPPCDSHLGINGTKQPCDLPPVRKMDSFSEEEEVKDSQVTAFPVSAAWYPPFTVYVNLVGQGDSVTGEDVSNEVTNWGSYQSGLSPARKPRVVDALAGALTSERAGGGSFLDIGAGLGYFSLAAAARGHSVIAFEMSEGSLELFLQSIAHNGYQDKIILHRVPLGAAHGDICVDRSHGLEGLQVPVQPLP
mmetsp:Transcript_13516/g.38424  ORF Transcript_13516/g.38424 Transcript_13516/m.38424 type:complete len:191 (-) Transcript_13516:843-1415(-)